MPELALVKIGNWPVEGLEKAEPLRSDSGPNDAAVVGLAHSGNQAALFHAVEEAGHVRVVGDHAVPDSLARETCGLGTAKDAKNIVLRAGEPRPFQEMFRFLAEGVTGLQERYEDAVLRRDGRARGLGWKGH